MRRPRRTRLRDAIMPETSAAHGLNVPNWQRLTGAATTRAKSDAEQRADPPAVTSTDRAAVSHSGAASSVHCAPLQGSQLNQLL